jgi:hypothetical protein
MKAIGNFFITIFLSWIWRKIRSPYVTAAKEINKALADTHNWKHYEDASESYFYNEFFPDITLVENRTIDQGIFYAPWTRRFSAPSHKTHFDLIYKGKKYGHPLIAVHADDARALIIAPSQWALLEYDVIEECWCSFYYIKGSREDLVNKIFQKKSLIDPRDPLNFPSFPSEDGARYALTEDIQSSNPQYEYYLAREEYPLRVRPTR